jgi:hypothetical protein
VENVGFCPIPELRDNAYRRRKIKRRASARLERPPVSAAGAEGEPVSVSTMTQLAENGAGTPQNALGLIAAYIPSEAIAIYLAALGILAPSATASPDQIVRVRLICFAAGLLVAVVIAFANLSAQGLTTGEANRRRLVVAALSGVAFAIYAAATPDFFFNNTYLTIGFTQWAAVGALVAAPLMPWLAKALNVRN